MKNVKRAYIFLSGIVLIGLLFATAASARDKISVTYAKDFSASRYKTYAWAEHGLWLIPCWRPTLWEPSISSYRRAAYRR